MKIAFYKAKHGSLLDKAINWCSGRDGYCHVAFLFSDGQLFESSGIKGGVRFCEMYNRDHWDIFTMNVNAGDECNIKKWCRLQDGKGYDWGGVLGFILPAKHMAGRWFCSEICCSALQNDGLIGKVQSWRVSPNELYLILKAARLVG